MNVDLHSALIAGAGLIRMREHRRLRGAIARAVRRGDLVRVRRGIYASQGTVTPLLRCRALALADPDVVFTGHTAAWLDAPGDVRPPDVITACSRLRTRAVGVATSRGRVDPDHRVQRHGLTCTARALTALHLAVDGDGAPIDDALRQGASLSLLWAALHAHPHRAGNRTIRRLLVDSRDEPWSEAERHAHRALRAAGIRGWRANLPVRLGATHAYLDLGFPDCRVGLEIDGFTHHQDRSSFERDRARDIRLALDGWRIHRFSAFQVLDGPTEFSAAVAGLVASARASGIRHRTAHQSPDVGYDRRRPGPGTRQECRADGRSFS